MERATEGEGEGGMVISLKGGKPMLLAALLALFRPRKPPAAAAASKPPAVRKAAPLPPSDADTMNGLFTTGAASL